MNSIRTDLALESGACERKMSNDSGILIHERCFDYGIKITDVCVENESGEKLIGKPVGKYITLDVFDVDFSNDDAAKKAVDVLADEIDGMITDYKKEGILVVGLGNRGITPDALGPNVCDRILVNRHLKEFAPESIDEKADIVSAIAPGVLGITGLETGEVIRGIVDRIKPGVVIEIDSLASRKLSRVSTTYQLTDTGISPG